MSSRKRWIWLCALLTSGAGVWFAFGQSDKPGKTDPQSIQVRVEMVSIPVVVTTPDGRRVADLEKKDFEVFEDKVPQQIAGFAATDEPISVALLLDNSGSMQRKLALVQREAIRFVNTLHPDDSVAVMSFADEVSLLEDFSIDRKRNEYGIKLTRSNGGTALYEGVWLALQEVLKPVGERKALVLFTDGVDTVSRKASEKETLELAKETQATIYCIYFNTEGDIDYRSPGTVGGVPLPLPRVRVGPGAQAPGSSSAEYEAGRRYLSQLSDYSGGVLFNALKSEDLGPAFEGIAKELSSQYSIGYYSTNTRHDGKFRKVEVRVRRQGLAVRAKKGYFALKDTASKDK